MIWIDAPTWLAEYERRRWMEYYRTKRLEKHLGKDYGLYRKLKGGDHADTRKAQKPQAVGYPNHGGA